MDGQKVVGQQFSNARAKNQPEEEKKADKKRKKRKRKTPTSFQRRMEEELFEMGLGFRFPDSETEEIANRMCRERLSGPKPKTTKVANAYVRIEHEEAKVEPKTQRAEREKLSELKKETQPDN